MIKEIALRKLANAYDDVQDGLTAFKEHAATNAVPGILSYGSNYINDGLVGSGTGLGGLLAHMSTKPEDIDPEDLKKFKSYSFVPFVGGYRAAKRNMYVDNKLSKGDSTHKHALSEKFGKSTSILAAILAGGGLGALGGGLGGAAYNKYGNGSKDAWINGAIGGALGGATAGGVVGILAHLIGRVRGLIEKRRSDEEHSEYLKEGVLGNYLLPGKAAYNTAKRAKMMNDYLY